MRLLYVIAITSLLAGCSWFSTTTSWTKPGTTPEQAEADLDSCREVARAQKDRDAQIDQDTAATMDSSSQGAVDTELSRNMASQRSGRRFDQIVDQCMRSLGYGPAQ